MSYMGPRYMGGGGQIFPHSQANQAGFQPQQFQQHLQVMQMQAQLQQKLQMQKQQHLAKGSEASKDKVKSEPGSAQGQNQSSRQNQPNENSKNQNQSKPTGPNPPSDQRHSGPNKPPVPDKNVNQNSKPNGNPPSSGPGGAGKGQENRSSNQNPDNKDKQDTSRSNQPSNASDNKSSNNSSRFGNKSQSSTGTGTQSQGNAGSRQQGSLMGQPPPLMPNPPKDAAVKSEPNPSPAKGHQGQSSDNYDYSNSHFNRQPRQSGGNSYEGGAGGQNQQHMSNSGNYNYRNNYGGNANSGPGANEYPKNMNSSSQQENSYKGNRPSQSGGRNMGNNSGDYKPNMANRLGPGSGPNSFNRGSKSGGGYYGSDRLKEKVEQMLSGPQIDLPEIDISEKKFNAYAKLFIGNLPKNTEQDELLVMFEKYGEIGPVYINKDSSFAFINFDYKASAAKAMREVDGKLFKNRFLKVRFATINEGIRVKNLSTFVSNELLEKTFSIFGQIESCRVVVDDRGNAKGEGIVIYRDKKCALLAVKKCSEECYFLSGAMRPVIVTPLEPVEDNVEGLPESVIPKNDEYRTEREISPHFADSDSFEFEFGMQWKQLFNMYEEKKTILNRDFQIELERLEKKMVLAKVEYETDKLRKELAQREAESAQLRRHFDGEVSGSSGGQYAGMSSSTASGYDSYNPGKRSLDQGGYDAPFNRPYDSQYSDGYNRGGYAGGEYDRSTYEQGYGGYNREEYRRGEGGYGHEEPYERPPYDLAKEIPPERPPTFDQTTEPGYKSTPAEVPPIAEPYKAPSKRPRY